MKKRVPMTCPQCRRAIRFLDVKKGRCPSCEIKLCVPKTYFRPAHVLAIVVTVVILVRTFSTFVKSPASFPLVMLWLLMLVSVRASLTLLFSVVSMFISPPTMEPPHANDDITVLRLHDD